MCASSGKLIHSIGKVTLVTYLHIRDSIFWVAGKLHCAQTGETVRLLYFKESFLSNSRCLLL